MKNYLKIEVLQFGFLYFFFNTNWRIVRFYLFFFLTLYLFIVTFFVRKKKEIVISTINKRIKIAIHVMDLTWYNYIEDLLLIVAVSEQLLIHLSFPTPCPS